MKILQVITSLDIGGAEQLVSEISPMLRDLGNQVDVLAFDGQNSALIEYLKNNNINVYSFGIHCNIYNPLFIYRLAKMMRHYDIVHTHNYSPQFFAAFGHYFSSCKLVTTEHNTSNRRRNISIFKIIDKWMYNRYSSIICISDMTKSNLIEHIGASKVNIETIYNGIRLEKYYNALPIKLENNNKNIVTMIAGFRDQKDHETIIKAFEMLDSSLFELWLVGDGERRNSIEMLIKKLQLDNVKLLGIRNDVPSILKASSIVVMSSHWEGFGLAAVEGMAAGKPVIASNVPGLAQVVGGAGILFTPRDYCALSEEIIKISSDKSYYNSVSKRCLERAKTYDIRKMVNEYNCIYQSLM